MAREVKNIVLDREYLEQIVLREHIARNKLGRLFNGLLMQWRYRNTLGGKG